MPKFKLNEEITIRTLRQNIRVIITKRKIIADVDNCTNYSYYYDFEEVRNIKDKWTWIEVLEQSIIDMQWAAKQYDDSMI